MFRVRVRVRVRVRGRGRVRVRVRVRAGFGLPLTVTLTLTRLGSVVRCYPDAGGRLPPSLRPPPTLPDACAPPAVLYDWFLTAGIYLLGT